MLLLMASPTLSYFLFGGGWVVVPSGHGLLSLLDMEYCADLKT